jgi:Zn-dependent peptidase ImmA (M78 family)
MNYGATDEQEAEANSFAMALLMPADLLREDVRRLGGVDLCDDAKVKLLAKRYQVPLTLMAIRLGQLLDPEHK